MTVLAIDPGSEQSAWVLFDGERVVSHRKEDNWTLRTRMMNGDWLLEYPFKCPVDWLVVEWIASYGMPVGAEVFDTARWVGHFEEVALRGQLRSMQMFRREVKLHLCQSARAKDANVRQALLDRFGGKQAAIGKKSQRGPCYGLKADEWAALGVAVTWWDLKRPVEAVVPVTRKVAL